MMVNNSTNIKKTNKHLLHQFIEHKKDHDIWGWNMIWLYILFILEDYCHIYVTPNGLIKLISKTSDLV
jgi:lipoprotein NlpI